MKKIRFTAHELLLLRGVVGMSSPRNLADMVHCHKIFEWMDFSDEEKSSIDWAETRSPDGSSRIQFNGDVEVNRECDDAWCRKIVGIVEVMVPMLRVDAWSTLMKTLLKLGWSQEDA